MTLADYSLSNVAFDHVDRWKDTLKQLLTSCNETEALGAVIPQLEEFIEVARSEWVCCALIGGCVINSSFMGILVISNEKWTNLHGDALSSGETQSSRCCLLFQDLGWLPPSLLVSTL